MSTILAKSPSKNGSGVVTYVTLCQHTRDVVESAKALFGDKLPSRLSKRWLSFFGIPGKRDVFHRNLIAACLLHDWGKANDTFQNAVLRKGTQAIRHEHLSALLISLPFVQSTLEGTGFDFPLIMSAVLSHHLKASSK